MDQFAPYKQSSRSVEEWTYSILSHGSKHDLDTALTIAEDPRFKVGVRRNMELLEGFLKKYPGLSYADCVDSVLIMEMFRQFNDSRLNKLEYIQNFLSSIFIAHRSEDGVKLVHAFHYAEYNEFITYLKELYPAAEEKAAEESAPAEEKAPAHEELLPIEEGSVVFDPLKCEGGRPKETGSMPLLSQLLSSYFWGSQLRGPLSSNKVPPVERTDTIERIVTNIVDSDNSARFSYSNSFERPILLVPEKYITALVRAMQLGDENRIVIPKGRELGITSDKHPGWYFRVTSENSKQQLERYQELYLNAENAAAVRIQTLSRHYLFKQGPQYTSKEQLQIVLEGFSKGLHDTDLPSHLYKDICLKYKISRSMYHLWCNQFSSHMQQAFNSQEGPGNAR